jgi:hypothetical protein
MTTDKEQRIMTKTFKGDPVSRAFSAYFRGADSPIQPSGDSGLVEHEGKEYVVLHNVNGVLAVYRVLNNGALRQLKRWPKEIEEGLV